MDHDAQLHTMDPKLKEAYERVMGFNHTAHHTPDETSSPQIAPDLSTFQNPPQPQQPIQTPSQPKADTVSDTNTPEQTAKPLEAMPRSEVPIRRSMETVHIETQPRTTPKPVVQEVKKKQETSPLIMWIGGLVFFFVYAIVWMKLLNVPIPFLGL